MKSLKEVKKENIIKEKKIFGFSIRSSDYAQALMELGALICKPKKPLCNQCPLIKNCKSFIKNDFEILPKKKKKIDNVIVEASSHGLDQKRLHNINFKAGIFTNFSQDHLDYHKNLNNYLKAKLYLFEKLIKKNGNVIADKEIPQFQKIKKITLNKN